MARGFELPPEARALLAHVSAAGDEIERLKKDLARDTQLVRAELEQRYRAAVEAQEAVDALIKSRIDGFGFIAKAWADYELAQAKAQAEGLRTKRHPARRAADEVRAKGRELAKLRRRAKLAEWLVALYEWHFPWLTELRDLDEEASYLAGEDGGENDSEDERQDPVRRWLTNEEYQALSTVERNQRALDRYLRSRKTRWQIGRDYERYVGYLREQAGLRVTYQGIFKGLEDLGRDVIAERDGEIEVIQCKRWAQHKVIHEKHVFQLFGTVVAMRIEHPDSTVRGTFVTTTAFSERAHEFARQLGIAVEENFPLENYPRVKCNITRATGERIYHLPFDQQYDATVIEPTRGERYVEAIAEAEELGFRRAWRWHRSAP